MLTLEGVIVLAVQRLEGEAEVYDEIVQRLRTEDPVMNRVVREMVAPLFARFNASWGPQNRDVTSQIRSSTLSGTWALSIISETLRGHADTLKALVIPKSVEQQAPLRSLVVDMMRRFFPDENIR